DVVLGIQRIMVDVVGGNVGRESGYVDAARDWKVIRVEGNDGVGVGRIAEERMHIAGDRVDNAGIDVRRTAAVAEAGVENRRRIIDAVGGDGDFLLVVVEAEAAAENEAA